ncbi:hypothetical protein BDFG_09342 [Blastomyces dermatitidis ATCC 26199]|nr:hypothetical protein BDFG_09342 [Blastomyces dermatitidis ATCC 26199]
MLSIPLEEARIESIPESAYYIPDFITQDEEERLLQKSVFKPPSDVLLASSRQAKENVCLNA